MKFAPVAVACLVAGATAQVARRDKSDVTDVLDNVSSNIEDLDDAINSFDGDAKPVMSAAEKLISVLKDGKSKVDNAGDLSTDDLLSLQDPVQDLKTKGMKLAKDLKSKKSDIEDAGLCEDTRKQVTDINSASQDLVKSAISKVPDQLQDIADDLSQGLKDELQDAQDDFSKDNCKNKGSGGGGGGGDDSGSSTSSGSASQPTDSASSPTDTSTSSKPSDSAGARALAPAGAGALAVAFAVFLL